MTSSDTFIVPIMAGNILTTKRRGLIHHGPKFAERSTFQLSVEVVDTRRVAPRLEGGL